MKAKDLKNHTKKLKNQEHFDKVEDKWGDTKYVYKSVIYNSEEELKKALSDYLHEEFKKRLKETY